MAAAQALTPAHRRRWTILACGLVFYVLANIKTPVSILFLAVSAAFAYCAAYAVYVSRKKPKKTVLTILAAVQYSVQQQKVTQRKWICRL